jgi:hypothetical protein
LISVATAILLAMLGACGVASRLIPGRPYPGEYVVNRDGHYFVGHRCVRNIERVGIFLQDVYAGDPELLDFDKAIWSAVADPPVVTEFELFAPDQPGAKVSTDKKERPLDNEVYIYMISPVGVLSIRATLDEITNNMVMGAQGVVTWNDYWQQSDYDYGC